MPQIIRSALLLALIALPAEATVLFRGDFETGDTSQFKGGPNQVHVTAIPSPVRDGKYAGRATLHNEDIWPNGLRRVEVGYAPPAATFSGSERYYALSVRTTPDLPLVATITNTLAYFESATSYHQVMAFNVMNGKVLFGVSLPKPGATKNAGTLWTGTFASEVWHDFILHVKWSADPAVGFVELWYDGEPVLAKTAVQTQYKDATATYPNFFHAGLLHGNFDSNAEALDLDRILEGTTFADVALVEPGDAGTPPVDSGTPPVDSGTPSVDSGTPAEDAGAVAETRDAGGPHATAPGPATPTLNKTDVAGSSCSSSGGAGTGLSFLLLLLSAQAVLRTTSRR